MALPVSVQLALRLVMVISSFLLQEHSPTCSELALLRVKHQFLDDGHNPSLMDSIVSYAAYTLGIRLPRALTVFDDLPVGTSFLLQITEIVPVEILLLLIIGGLFVLVCMTTTIVILVLYVGIRLSIRCMKSICNQFRSFITHNTTYPLSYTTAQCSLSDAAQAIAPTVNAHESGMRLRNRRGRSCPPQPSQAAWVVGS